MSIRSNIAVAGLSLAVILGGAAAASASEMTNDAAKPAAVKTESHKTEAKKTGEKHKTTHKKETSKKADTAKDEMKK